jgi:hypothetical protein
MQERWSHEKKTTVNAETAEAAERNPRILGVLRVL